MGMKVDHYAVLGLESGEGAKYAEKDITNAYRKLAKQLHPDKNLHDPNAYSNFQKLQASYEILKDEKTRKLFDDQLRFINSTRTKYNSKRQKLFSDLQKREQAAAAAFSSSNTEEYEEEVRIANKFKEEVASIRAKFARSQVKPLASVSVSKRIKISTNLQDRDNIEFMKPKTFSDLNFKSYEDSVLQKLQKVSAM